MPDRDLCGIVTYGIWQGGIAVSETCRLQQSVDRLSPITPHPIQYHSQIWKARVSGAFTEHREEPLEILGLRVQEELPRHRCPPGL